MKKFLATIKKVDAFDTEILGELIKCVEIFKSLHLPAKSRNFA